MSQANGPPELFSTQKLNALIESFDGYAIIGTTIGTDDSSINNQQYEQCANKLRHRLRELAFFFCDATEQKGANQIPVFFVLRSVHFDNDSFRNVIIKLGRETYHDLCKIIIVEKSQATLINGNGHNLNMAQRISKHGGTFIRLNDLEFKHFLWVQDYQYQ
jgi:hypothetical protein